MSASLTFFFNRIASRLVWRSRATIDLSLRDRINERPACPNRQIAQKRNFAFLFLRSLVLSLDQGNNACDILSIHVPSTRGGANVRVHDTIPVNDGGTQLLFRSNKPRLP
jgi:hypothetical protein